MTLTKSESLHSRYPEVQGQDLPPYDDCSRPHKGLLDQLWKVNQLLRMLHKTAVKADRPGAKEDSSQGRTKGSQWSRDLVSDHFSTN